MTGNLCKLVLLWDWRLKEIMLCQSQVDLIIFIVFIYNILDLFSPVSLSPSRNEILPEVTKFIWLKAMHVGREEVDRGDSRC